MPCVEGELCHVPATSPKPTEAHGCQGGCGGRLHATCGSNADDNEMHRICSHCLARGEKRKAVAPPKRKATEPPKGDGAEKSKARKVKKFLTVEQKVEVLDMLQRKVLSQGSIADIFGCSVQTIGQVKADRVKVKEMASKAGAGGKKLSRPSNFPEVDESVLDLFAKAREAKISVTRDVIRSFGRSAKATLLATPTTSAAVRAKLENFTAGYKWASNFAERNGLGSLRRNRVTQSRIDGVHCRESTDTGPENLKQFPALTPGGRNVRCMIMVDIPAQGALGLPQRSMRYGPTYTHVEAGGGKGGSGTSDMLHLIANYGAMLHASPHLTKSPKMRKTEAPTVTPPPSLMGIGSTMDVRAQGALGLPQRSIRCGPTYTHVEAGGGKGRSGTSGMLNHVVNYGAMLHASPHLTKSPKVRKTEANKKKKKVLTPPRESHSKTPFSAPATQPTTPQTALSGDCPHPELSPQPDFRLRSAFSLRPDVTVAQPGRPSQADRSLILMCALNTLDPSAVSGSLGLRVFVDTLSPARTGRSWTPPPPTMPPAMLDETLSELKASIESRVYQALVAQLDSCRRLGWSGPFVALQVDMVGEHGFEFCTASVAFVAEDFGGLTRLAVSARWFRGRATASSAEAWIRELTSETFKEMCGESDPKKIFLAATVGATSTAIGFPPGSGSAGSAEVKDALRELGVPVVTCFSSRLHSVAMRSLGCASACSPDDFCRSSGDTLGSTGGEDDKQSSSNPTMRKILDKATAMIRAFENWPRRDGGDSKLEPLLEELEDLVVVSERAQLACASWTAKHATLESLLLLMEPLDAYFRANPVVDSLLPAEWQTIREAVSILDPAIEVVAKFDDPDPGQVRAEGEGSGVSLAEAISLYAHLHQSFVFPTQDIRVDGNRDGPLVSERVENLTPEARLQLGVLSRSMQEVGLGRALEDVEAVSMALHPRLKACSQSACVNGGAALKAQAVAAISAELKKFELLSRLEKMRKAHDLALGYSITPGVAASGSGSGSSSGSDEGVGFGGSGGTNPLSGAAADAVRELGEYMVEASAVTGRGLLSFWKLHGTDTLDSGTGKVVLSARWPHLGLVARLYAGVEAVSRQAERHFGGGGNGGGNLGLGVRGLRTSMAPKRVEKMVLLRMNQHLLPEVQTFRGRYEAGAAVG